MHSYLKIIKLIPSKFILFVETFKAALAQESHDALFSNTEDERAAIKAAKYARDHPVLSKIKSNTSNVNYDDEYQHEDEDLELTNDPLDLNHIVPRKGEIFYLFYLLIL